MKGYPSGKGKAPGVCYKCGRTGHWAKDCRSMPHASVQMVDYDDYDADYDEWEYYQGEDEYWEWQPEQDYHYDSSWQDAGGGHGNPMSSSPAAFHHQQPMPQYAQPQLPQQLQQPIQASSSSSMTTSTGISTAPRQDTSRPICTGIFFTEMAPSTMKTT